MRQNILERVRRRAQSNHTRTDNSELSPSLLCAKLSADQLVQSTNQLGFEPPVSFIELLQAVGNGGFGPGYGLMGLIGGATDDMGNTAVKLYTDFAQPDPDDPTWKWPHGLLPICHWGCAIYSCIDCTRAEAPVKTWDPNEWEAGTSPKLAIRSSEVSFAEWLDAWSEGLNLWDRMFPAP